MSESANASAPITSYLRAWDFGYGTSGQGATASHTYATAGAHLVRLMVTDQSGLIDTAASTVTVVDEPPVATFATPASPPEAGQPTPFDGSAPSDPDGSIVSYAWSFGDGHRAWRPATTHAYASPGTHSVTLTVTGSGGQTSSLTRQLTVLVDGADLRVVVRRRIHGHRPHPSRAYAAPGTYSVRLTVTDSVGASVTVTQQVTVLDEPPIAAFGLGPSVPVPNQSVAFDADASSDPDGAIVSYTWDFGDGTRGRAAGAQRQRLIFHAGNVQRTVDRRRQLG